MAKLKELRVNSCFALDTLAPELGQLPELDKLTFLACRRLLSLPPESGNLTNLQSLNLTFCTGLSALPSIKDLTNLQILNVSQCRQLTHLSLSLILLPNIRFFILKGCLQLKAWPGIVVQSPSFRIIRQENEDKKNC